MTIKPSGFCRLHNLAGCWTCRDAPQEYGPVGPPHPGREQAHSIREVRWRASDGNGVWSCSCGEVGSGVGYPSEFAVAHEADQHASAATDA